METNEANLNITMNGQYKNLILKTRYKKNNGNLVIVNGQKQVETQGLEDGEFIVVQKVFVEGYENNGKFGVSFSCKVKYKDEECSFWLNEKEHDAYKVTGGIDDKVKISCKKVLIVNPKSGAEILVPRLSFELVE